MHTPKQSLWWWLMVVILATPVGSQTEPTPLSDTTDSSDHGTGVPLRGVRPNGTPELKYRNAAEDAEIVKAEKLKDKWYRLPSRVAYPDKRIRCSGRPGKPGMARLKRAHVEVTEEREPADPRFTGDRDKEIIRLRGRFRPEKACSAEQCGNNILLEEGAALGFGDGDELIQTHVRKPHRDVEETTVEYAVYHRGARVYNSQIQVRIDARDETKDDVLEIRGVHVGPVHPAVEAALSGPLCSEAEVLAAVNAALEARGITREMRRPSASRRGIAWNVPERTGEAELTIDLPASELVEPGPPPDVMPVPPLVAWVVTNPVGTYYYDATDCTLKGFRRAACSNWRTMSLKYW